MSSDDYTIQNIYKYTRKTYKKSQNEPVLDSALVSPRNKINLNISETSPTNERFTTGTAGCSCDADHEGEIANIFHRKRPVIELAQQQLQKLLDERNLLPCDNIRCCRSLSDFLKFCKDSLWDQNKCKCGVFVILFCVFVCGLILGGATCGTTLGKFNSPILTCIDNFFIPDTYTKIEDTYRSIV